jgi:hypothetical protein
MEKFFKILKNTVAVVLAVCVVIMVCFSLFSMAEALNEKDFAMALNVWEINFLTIPLALAALRLLEHKNKTCIIGEAFFWGVCEIILVGFLLCLAALENGDFLSIILWSSATVVSLLILVSFGCWWTTARRIAAGTYVDRDDEEELAAQEAALREMQS